MTQMNADLISNLGGLPPPPFGLPGGPPNPGPGGFLPRRLSFLFHLSHAHLVHYVPYG